MSKDAVELAAARGPTDRWIVEGCFVLETPLHLGDGGDEPRDDLGDAAVGQEEVWIATLARAAGGKPYLPGSSLKGALRALAQRCGCDAGFMKRVFGTRIGNATEAGLVEFHAAMMVGVPKPGRLVHFEPTRCTAVLPHVAIERATGAAADQKLFHQAVVPPGTAFAVKLVANRLKTADIAQLLWLLERTTGEPLFRLGGGVAQDHGRVTWQGAAQPIRRFGKEHVAAWLLGLVGQSPGPWHKAAKPSGVRSRAHEAPNTALHSFGFDIALNFHAPFLVKHKPKKLPGDDTGADAVPRRNHAGRIVLPASSAHGALRAQCERILKTLGFDLPANRDAALHAESAAFTDLAALLFGAPGWRSVVRCSDFTADADRKPVTQEMNAIDRLTGGGKEGAKFKVDYADCPMRLTGQITIDLRRLRNARLALSSANGATAALDPALGLLTLLWRDTAEGDVSFGHGRAKGYGQCIAPKLLQAWSQAVQAGCGTKAPDAVAAFRALLPPAAAQPALPSAPPAVRDESPPPVAPIAVGDTMFHNPYAFIPFALPGSADWQPIATLGESQHSHASYAGLNGRIVCELTTRTPVFVGSTQTRGAKPNGPVPAKPGVADPFKLGDKLALPATSLRGMLSSLFENISASNVRVMHDATFSVRASMEESLSAMGRLCQREGNWFLEPLCMPTLELDMDPANEETQYPLSAKWHPAFFVDSALLKVYFDPPTGAVHPCTEPFYMRLGVVGLWSDQGDVNVWVDGEGDGDGHLAHLRFAAGRSRFLIGQKPGDILSAAEYARLEPAQGREYTRGYVRSLKERGRDLPDTVVHHLFIPYPESRDALSDAERHLLPVDKSVINTFHALANTALERMNDKPEEARQSMLLPYVPIGRNTGDRNKSTDYRTRVCEGDLVYFDVAEDGKSVTEISFSSIWRRAVKPRDGSGRVAHTAGDFLRSTCPDLLPLGLTDRASLSPAELLFGVVDHKGSRKDAEPGDDRSARAFAAKVRIGYGFAPKGRQVCLVGSVLLKELSSPKPPSPALYFQPAAGKPCHVSKAELASQPAQYRYNGRKAYLHSARDTQGASRMIDDRGVFCAPPEGRPPWQSKYDSRPDKDNHRRLRVNPIAAEEVFFFDVDFRNLTKGELQQLLATLHPFAAFEHKLGLGKPIGLGSVKIIPVGLFFTQRYERYAQQDPFAAQRYASVWRDPAEAADWPDHLAVERSAAVTPDAASPLDLAAEGFAQVQAPIRKALQLLGDPDQVQRPVHYPQRAGLDIESEQFKWFVYNDGAGKQTLKPIVSALPVLRR